MTKKRSLNELRQEKNYGYTQPKLKKEEYSIPEPKDDIEATKALIISTLKDDLFDIIFQAVNEEMSQYYVFQQENYLTEAGEDLFMDEWFQFYHEHHGDILGAIMKNFTN
tara:strand:+ start:124 stop:453 length:330 start_codon:yes stop_codon:yes gene_type:complete